MKGMSIHEMGGRMICDLRALTWCKYDICMRWFMELKWWVWY